MSSILAIVSRAVFEKVGRDAAVGDVIDVREYLSTNKALEPLREGGALFLVTVRPPEELCLVAALGKPFDNVTAADGRVAPVTLESPL